MILGDLLALPVHDSAGRFVGHVLDARFVIDGAPHQLLADARLAGLLISPHSRASYLGYERSGVTSPALLDDLLRFLHRGTFYVEFSDIGMIGRERLTLREDYRRYAPGMPSS